MPRKTSVALVIDASVARAAGQTEHLVSSACRAFLQEVLTICHRVVMTTEISREWHEHRSNFAYGWFSSMTARKKVVRSEQVENAPLRRAVRSLELEDSSEQAVLKDIHLVEAALATDKTVVSIDDSARTLLRGIASRVVSIRPVVWVDPTKENEDAVEWLRHGAEAERERQLGFR